jgi:hypothetical protein
LHQHWLNCQQLRGRGLFCSHTFPCAYHSQTTFLSGCHQAKVPTDTDWDAFLAKFPIEKSGEEKTKRMEIFAAFDPNGNGYLSLAEIDKGCRDILGLYELFDAKKAIMRAYQAAKGIGNHGVEQGDDYVEKPEFRLLLKYLRDYFVLWKIF